MTKMTNLTALETAALSAIVNSEYRDGCGDLTVPVWTFSVVDALVQYHGLTEQGAGGVISSLVKKGLADVDEFDTDSAVWLTAAGIAAAGC